MPIRPLHPLIVIVRKVVLLLRLAVLEAGRPDAASLDMNLNGESSAPIAAALREQRIPFVVVTGYTGKHHEDPTFQGAPLLRKPYDGAQLVRTLVGLLA
ncbi:response regulator [Roseitranquillus sediminis]|uniref:hypothetical protein n=1 Tax=Roseitranquillus sediminis TaxID=2809051 RepID=UPI001D0CCB3A|nr:hypothetical protein [Roseitranquillus sediminis]MBM9595497.1 hypothetical protein [Roseitranquillus sediminis]